MKAGFYLQRSFAYLGHQMAILLKEKYNVQDFCGYVFLRSSYEFLKNQKDIRYSDLMLDEDIHPDYKKANIDWPFLRWLEKEYGLPNLWPYLDIDRIITRNQLLREYPYDRPTYTYEEMLKILQTRAKTIINFLDKEKPDFLVFSAIGSVGGLLLYKIAKKRGIKTLVIMNSLIENKFFISEDYDDLTGLLALMRQPHPKPSEAKAFLEKFRSRPAPYYVTHQPNQQPIQRLQQLNFLHPFRLIKSIIAFIKSITDYWTKGYRQDYSTIKPWDFLKDRLKRKIRNLRGVSDLYDPYQPNADFAYFPLHYEPEISLDLWAPFFNDQLYVIKQTAKSLPIGFQLYVKEHPQMAPYRPRSFYKELKKIPNLKLLPPEVSSFDILRQSKLIVTITGTGGWEGALFKKPVIAFGKVFWTNLSFVKKCQTISQLPYLVKEQLENFQYNEEELINLIATVLEESASVNFIYLWESETDRQKQKAGLESLVDLMAKKLGLSTHS